MWGQAALWRVTCKAVRIIPTRVGTSVGHIIADLSAGDHPHACGDKSTSTANVQKSTGSSPRVWGQGNGGYSQLWLAGIIPTRVGTRLMKYIPDGSVEDHPHACGDKASNIIEINISVGSSPRVWGQGLPQTAQVALCGIIPTRVGTRVFYADIAYYHRDHPHACGDK